MSSISSGWRLKSVFLIAFFISGCNGGNEGNYPELNLKWRREYPPTRSEYSSIIFSREVGGEQLDCLTVSGTHLFIRYLGKNADSKLPAFELSTAASRVVVGVTKDTKIESGRTAKNLGLVILERRGGKVEGRVEGGEK